METDDKEIKIGQFRKLLIDVFRHKCEQGISAGVYIIRLVVFCYLIHLYISVREIFPNAFLFCYFGVDGNCKNRALRRTWTKGQWACELHSGGIEEISARMVFNIFIRCTILIKYASRIEFRTCRWSMMMLQNGKDF